MEQVELPSNFRCLSRSELVSWSLRINPQWVTGSHWSRAKLLDRLCAWQSNGRLRAWLRECQAIASKPSKSEPSKSKQSKSESSKSKPSTSKPSKSKPSKAKSPAAQAIVSEKKQMLGELMQKTSRELVAEVKALSGGPVGNRSKAETAAQLLQLQRGRQMLSHALDAGAASSGVRIGDAPSVNAGPGKALRKPSLKTKPSARSRPSLKTKPSARSRPSRKSRPSRLKKKKPSLKTKPSQGEIVCKEKASFD